MPWKESGRAHGWFRSILGWSTRVPAWPAPLITLWCMNASGKVSSASRHFGGSRSPEEYAMQKYDNRMILGLLLMAAGVFYLLQTLGLLVLSQLVWAAAAGAAGLFFLVIAVRGQWWAWIPSLTL